MGWRTIARDYRKQHPPSPLGLENAITASEDEIVHAQPLPAQGSRVRTKDPLIREIAVSSGQPPVGETIFPLHAVGHRFQRLAAQASRWRRSEEDLPAGDNLAAALVILRELMHHIVRHEPAFGATELAGVCLTA